MFKKGRAREEFSTKVLRYTVITCSIDQFQVAPLTDAVDNFGTSLLDRFVKDLLADPLKFEEVFMFMTKRAQIWVNPLNGSADL